MIKIVSKAILSRLSAHLKVPDNVLIQNENIAVSLALLNKHLTKKLI
jgi:NADH/NAD ratio-sensing transcriptional regulator Rex